MRRTRLTAPYILRTRYPATCAETGASLPKGTEAVYYPDTRTLYSLQSKAAEEFRALQFSRAYRMADADF